MAKEKCGLCDQERELKDSHVIPKFVLKWRLKTQQGPMRMSEEPNKRIQDSYKSKLLCAMCEQKIGDWENKFRNLIFIPYKDKVETNFHYKGWMLKFAVSLVYRAVLWLKKEATIENLNGPQIRELESALNVWREFLLDEIGHPGKYSLHFWMMDLIEDTDGKVPENINNYLLTALDIDLFCSQNELFVYVKFLEFIFVAPLQEKVPKHWRSSRLSVKNGGLAIPFDIELPEKVWSIIKARCEHIQSSFNNITSSQHEKIGQYIKANESAYKSSDAHKANTQDVELMIKGKTERD